MRDRFRPAPEPPLKIRPSSRYQFRIDSIVSSTDRMKQALTCCGRRGADVEPDRRVEAEHLVQQHPGQLVGEDLGVRVGGEVAAVDPGPVVGTDDPVDQLAQAGLALRGADGAAEVLAGDDVRGVHRPVRRELHAALLEVDRAVPPVRHDDVPALPLDLVVGMHPRGGEDTLARRDRAWSCPPPSSPCGGRTSRSCRPACRPRAQSSGPRRSRSSPASLRIRIRVHALGPRGPPSPVAQHATGGGHASPACSGGAPTRSQVASPATLDRRSAISFSKSSIDENDRYTLAKRR